MVKSQRGAVGYRGLDESTVTMILERCQKKYLYFAQYFAVLILEICIIITAELKMQIDDRPARTLIFVDNSLQLYFYFDVYGSTQAIKLIGMFSEQESIIFMFYRFCIIFFVLVNQLLCYCVRLVTS